MTPQAQPVVDPYRAFLEAKVCTTPTAAVEIAPGAVNPMLKRHQEAIVRWMVEGGQRACFAAFGLGKTFIQLEVMRLTLERVGGRGLIVVPLGVRQEFMKDAATLGIPVRFVRSIEECDETGIYLTNYETVRDGKLDPRHFTAASLDEAAVLRGFGGTKTFREFMRLFAGDGKTLNARVRGRDVRYRFVATATPSPNDYIELLSYAAFLGIMDVSAAKTRFFKRDSTKADKLTLHPHKEREFWLWVSTWAVFVQCPSDITGDSADDIGYELPPLDVRWHMVPTDHRGAVPTRDGQARMFKNAALGVVEASREKRDSLPARIAKMLEIIDESPDDHFLLWHDLEAERRAIEDAFPGIATVYGSQDLDEREGLIADFAEGRVPKLAAKPVMLGSGCNLQRFCHRAIFLGIGFKFNDFIQAIHRIQRFLQLYGVGIDLIYTEAEAEVRRTLERKWKQYTELVANMTEIIRKYGLSHSEMARELTRSMGVERVEVSGEHYTIANNDCVFETRRMKDNSVGLVFSSFPFAGQYEYSPNYADFGHTDNNEHFFLQVDFLVPELFRVVQPGRLAVIHVKDRIVPGGMTGLGFQVVYPFHKQVIENFTTCPDCRVRMAEERHRLAVKWGLASYREYLSQRTTEVATEVQPCTHLFSYMGMKTIVTDVVRENNQTYRLAWGEQLRDGTKMGVGMPEYLLIFRKPPTDNGNSYADVPVVKPRPLVTEEDGSTRRHRGTSETQPIIPGSGYTLSRWQVDAHGFARSNGNRPLTVEDLDGVPHERIFKMFREYSLKTVYDFEHHVRLGEELEMWGALPTTFMLLQPQSWHPDVWTDITRMLTLNGAQHAKGREMHLCPMQLDLADRVIEQMSNPGDVVYDPFGGLMTVPSRAVLKGRYGYGVELSTPYFLDGAMYCKAAEEQVSMPSLLDLVEALETSAETREGAA